MGGIPPAPRGTPQIEVTFEVDRNGILKVSALEKASGSTNSITITQDGRLSQEEIDRMIQTAEEFASEDEASRKKVEVINEMTTFVYSLKSQFADINGWTSKVSLPFLSL